VESRLALLVSHSAEFIFSNPTKHGRVFLLPWYSFATTTTSSSSARGQEEKSDSQVTVELHHLDHPPNPLSTTPSAQSPQPSTQHRARAKEAVNSNSALCGGIANVHSTTCC
jgi:hypothetical protein